MLFSELVSMLLNQKTTVYLVSGGFRSLIEPLAEYLGIPKKNIFANKLLFCDGMLSQCLPIFIGMLVLDIASVILLISLWTDMLISQWGRSLFLCHFS